MKRRSFLSGAAAALAGVLVRTEAAEQTDAPKSQAVGQAPDGSSFYRQMFEHGALTYNEIKAMERRYPQ